MTQVTNNLIMTILMLLIAASIVYVYNENINDKIDKVRLELKWVNDGTNKVLMSKQNEEWYVVPTELIDKPRYYPLNTIKNNQ